MQPNRDPLEADNGTVPPVPYITRTLIERQTTAGRLKDLGEAMARVRYLDDAGELRHLTTGEQFTGMYLAAYCGLDDGIAYTSARGLGPRLGRPIGRVTRDVRALVAAGVIYVVPDPERGRHRRGYLFPLMVNPGPRRYRR